MIGERKIIDENLLFVICPKCRSQRKKIFGKFNIIKKGKERNGFARFFCNNCKSWFNEKTGDCMGWKYYR